MKERMTRFWRLLRTLAGDDAYDRYRAHHVRYHGDAPMLDERAFYMAQQRQKWNGVSRCC